MQEVNEKTPDCSDSEEEIPINYFSPHDAKDFTVGKIVWVHYGKVWWPALVRRLYPRDKKAMIVFVDQPVNEKGQENKLKVSYNRIMRFNCTRKNEFMNATGKPGLKAAIDLAVDYMFKVCDKSLYVSPIEYFRNPISNLLRKLQLESEDPEEEPQATASSQADADEALPEDVVELIDSGQSDEEEGGKEQSCAVRNTEEENDDDELVAKILAIIKREDCRKYLTEITQKKIECQRQYLYLNPTRINRARLVYPLFGPIKNYNQKWELVKYLTSILEPLKCFDNSTMKLNYVLKVWVAEIIIKPVNPFYRKGFGPISINFALREIFNLDHAAADRKLWLTGSPKECSEPI